MNVLSPEMTIVLLMARLNPSDDIIERVEMMLHEPLNRIDFDNVFRLASEGGVSGLLYNNFNKLNSVPKGFLKRLENCYFQTVRNNVLHLRETIRVLKLLGNEGIEVLPLKGSIAADVIFGNSGLYPTSDIDILIRRADIDRAEEVLQRNGFTKTCDLKKKDLINVSYHVCYGNDKYVVEVHWNLVVRYFEADPDFWWKDIIAIRHEGIEITLLSAERYLLYAIFRLFSHTFRPLRYSVFVSALISAHGRKIDWQKLIACSESLKMKRLTLFSLRFMREVHGNEIPTSMEISKIWGFDFIKQLIVVGFFAGAEVSNLRMLSYIFLLDTPLSIIRVILRRIFPSMGEIRLRYGLPHNSKIVCIYYIMNPVLLLLKKR